jgi:hypothetical protein
VDGHEANSRFSQFCENVSKCNNGYDNCRGAVVRGSREGGGGGGGGGGNNNNNNNNNNPQLL